MGIIRDTLSRLGRIFSRDSFSPSFFWLSRRDSLSGVNVSETSSLSLSAVFAGVTLLSRVIGSLPLHVYKQDGKNRIKLSDSKTAWVLGWQFNPEMTAAVARRTMEFHRLLWGSSYAEIQWGGNGHLQALWPIEPWRVKPERDADGNLQYRIDNTYILHPSDLIINTLVSSDGVVGRSFIDYAVESLGLGISSQEFASAYFGNGARPGVILRHPGNPGKELREEQRKQWESRHKGSSKAFSTAVLWGGWEYVGTDGQFDPQKSQLLEQRRFTTEEVARWLNLPPHLLRDLSRATFSNIEQQNIDFVTYSVGPTLVEQEQEYSRKLLNPPTTYVKYNLNALLRGDSAARSAYYREQWHIGAMSINEIRELEERNPIPGGDEHFVPANMVPLNKMMENKNVEN